MHITTQCQALTASINHVNSVARGLGLYIDHHAESGLLLSEKLEKLLCFTFHSIGKDRSIYSW